MTIPEYLKELNLLYKSGHATEHSYRGHLATMISTLVPDVQVTNEPQRIACGAPDYIITRKAIPIGFIEAKDVGTDLFNKTYKEQFDRYKTSLNNLIITDYLNFQFFVDGVLSTTISIGHIENGKIVSETTNFDLFTRRITEFCSFTGQTITSAQKLAKLMAAKARLLADVIERALTGSESNSTGTLFEEANNTLHDQFESFKTVLIHDITYKSFADMYAQTIAYGMFAARLNDPSLDTFTRQEAADLVPKTNPFLRRLFQYIAGYDLDDRIKWLVDALADVFRATNVAELLKDFGTEDLRQDPIIHFYETFLSEYDPSLRKSRGVWYTPHPVVNFIVRAVDDILKDEFGLPQGLADTSKVKVKLNVQGKIVEKEVHRVQFLDPAAGTGTFIAEIISQVHKKFEGQQGLWSNYVEEHLIPRLNGFEILMASYAMAHLKLELLLKETGYKPIQEQRFRVYLTNSLEEHHPDTGTLFASWLSHEANEANLIKRDTPVMVVLGNPPYSVSSSNKGAWIETLIADYKKELNERNIQPLSDDYIKFIRFGHFYIDKTKNGVLAYISNNSFIDGIIHRQMRRSLLESFDKVYILDLHGNSNKKETTPDGLLDQNVFDIMQGVSINIFVRSGEKKNDDLGKIFHSELFGKRDDKYNFLTSGSLYKIGWKELDYTEPYYFFVNKNFNGNDTYNSGFIIDEMFLNSNVGINTEFDELALQETEAEANRTIEILRTKNENECLSSFNLNPNSIDKLRRAINDIKLNDPRAVKILVKPFDEKYSIYTGKANGIMGRPRNEIMQNFLKGKNIALISMRQYAYDVPYHCYTFLSQNIVTSRLFISNKGYCSAMPLYTYPEKYDNSFLIHQSKRIPNLNVSIVSQIAESLHLQFTPEKEPTEGTFASIDLLDYIYAVLHSPTYREKYKEFLKIDFPRVPYPKDTDTFWRLVKLGSELRQLHLMESPALNNLITQYPLGGSNLVEKVIYQDERVYINKEQYFANVPQMAWKFYIGGYQPAQKWLKDRKGRTLLFDDILHYQKIVVALAETDRLMREIDKTWRP